MLLDIRCCDSLIELQVLYLNLVELLGEVLLDYSLGLALLFVFVISFASFRLIHEIDRLVDRCLYPFLILSDEIPVLVPMVLKEATMVLLKVAGTPSAVLALASIECNPLNTDDVVEHLLLLLKLVLALFEFTGSQVE